MGHSYDCNYPIGSCHCGYNQTQKRRHAKRQEKMMRELQAKAERLDAVILTIELIDDGVVDNEPACCCTVASRVLDDILKTAKGEKYGV